MHCSGHGVDHAYLTLPASARLLSQLDETYRSIVGPLYARLRVYGYRLHLHQKLGSIAGITSCRDVKPRGAFICEPNGLGSPRLPQARVVVFDESHTRTMHPFYNEAM